MCVICKEIKESVKKLDTPLPLSLTQGYLKAITEAIPRLGLDHFELVLGLITDTTLNERDLEKEKDWENGYRNERS